MTPSSTVAPTVDQAAAEAGMSRTTAFRHFPNLRALLIAAQPETQVSSYLPPGTGGDPEERLVAAVSAFLGMILDTEAQRRTMLRLSLDPSTTVDQLPLRQGRSIGWFEDALSPLRPTLTADGVHRLAVAVRSAVGIESRVWLTDVAGLTRTQATQSMIWAARAMLHEALAGTAGVTPGAGAPPGCG